MSELRVEVLRLGREVFYLREKLEPTLNEMGAIDSLIQKFKGIEESTRMIVNHIENFQ